MEFPGSSRVTLRRIPGPGTALGKYLMIYHRIPSPTNPEDSDNEEVFVESCLSQHLIAPPASPRTPTTTVIPEEKEANFRENELIANRPSERLSRKLTEKNSPGMFRKCLARQKSHIIIQDNDAFPSGVSKDHRNSTESGYSAKYHLSPETVNNTKTTEPEPNKRRASWSDYIISQLHLNSKNG